MKYLSIIFIIILLQSCDGHSQKESQSPKNEKALLNKNEIEYKSFLNTNFTDTSSILTNYEDLFGEWEIQYILGEPEFLPIEDFFKRDSILLSSKLRISKDFFEQKGLFEDMGNNFKYKIEKISVDSSDFDFRGTTYFYGYNSLREKVDFLWVGKNRTLEVINKKELAFFAGSAGKYYFYIYHKKDN